MMTNDWVIPPSNPGVHWRWNVSLDLLITVQFSTGSGATRINKDIKDIQKTVGDSYVTVSYTIQFYVSILKSTTLSTNFTFLYATHHFPYFLHVILKTANVVFFFQHSIYIFAAPVLLWNSHRSYSVINYHNAHDSKAIRYDQQTNLHLNLAT